MKPSRVILASILFIALLAVPAYAKPIIIKFSHVVAVNTPKGQATEYFKKLVEERSGGNIKVEVYPNASLYDDTIALEALSMNACQMAAPSFSKFTSFVPQLQLFDLPFLFNDANHLHNVLQGEVGKKLLGMVAKRGLIGLAYWDNGFKQLSANKPLLEPADAKRLKFRIMPSKVIEAQFKALGGAPQVLPFSEVYSALRQGVVDAAENPLSNFFSKKFYEVQSDLTLSNHGYLGYMVVTNKIFWKKLSDQQREIVSGAIAEATEYGNKLAMEMDSRYLEDVKRAGTTVHELSAEQRLAWKEELKSIYPEFYDVIGKDLIEQALATGK
ncbi:MAG: C4-dicarboxylate ABC transporter [Desulfuromonas sp.]|nr:MAG: C4-dicarboxylate ABC transporter [Desulfuromonas sp.]